jgi:hypothetical protein
MAVWARIIDFPDYAISDGGQVMRLTAEQGIREGKILRPRPVGVGYLRASLQQGKIRCGKYVHRLVAEHHIPNPKNLPEVNHKDGNKENPTACNLEWVTKPNNMQHAYSSGLAPRGSQRSDSKLTEEKIATIRRLYSQGRLQEHLAREFGVGPTTVHRIVHRQSWKHC